MESRQAGSEFEGAAAASVPDVRATQAVRRSHQLLRAARDQPGPAETLDQSLRSLVADGRHPRAIFYVAIPGMLRVRSSAGDSTAPLPFPGTPRALQGFGRLAEAIRRGEPTKLPCPADLEANTEGHSLFGPVRVDGSVNGVVAVDTPADASELDRQAMGIFAEGLGMALESSLLRERLQAQRRHFQQLSMTGDAIMRELSEEPLVLETSADCGWAALPNVRAIGSAADGADLRDPLLSARELEVLSLITEGARNKEIATRLCLSEATVKSHVRRILRKLHAGNRAEAVSRYNRLRAG